MASALEGFIKKFTGSWTLNGKKGEYTCELRKDSDWAVLTDEDGNQIGDFTCEPVPWPDKNEYKWDCIPSPFWDGIPHADMPVIGICNSEIIAEIQKPESDGAYFVLPSQLNGAEYPSPNNVVNRVEEYKYDNTGGPRGQLAVHPAVGQFIIDNAACDSRPDGINAIDELLAKNDKFRLKNGYLQMPLPDSQEESDKLLANFMKSIDTLRPLITTGIPARGLTPGKGSFNLDAEHKVNLVYASAVPVETYNNRPTTQLQKELHRQVAEAILVAQYYGAMKTAARRGSTEAKTKVMLMPLGGGVFNNSIESIGKSMSKAIEMLAEDERNRLEVNVLTWNGNPQEKLDMCRILQSFNKLAE